MKTLFKTLTLFFMITACTSSGEFPKIAVDYPITEKILVTDNYFGTDVTDNYRWLEDDRSEETTSWVKSQNKVSFDYLDKIPFREAIRNRLDELAGYDAYGIPKRIDNKTYYFKKTGLQNHYVFYLLDETSGEENVILDPNKFSEDGTTSISDVKFSKSGRLLAYSISEGGSDWRKIIVIDVNTLEQVGDTIHDAKFTDITWNKDEGFFYSSYDKPKGSELSAMTDRHKVYYHKLGTKQVADKLVYGKDAYEKRRYVGVEAFKNSDNLFLSAAESTTGNELYVKRGISSSHKFTPLFKGFENDYSAIHAEGDEVFILTNKNAPNKRVVKVNLNKPEEKDWNQFVAEKEESIESVAYAGGYIFVQYLKDAISLVEQYNLSGELVRELELPGIGSASKFKGNDDDSIVFYAFESFTTPYSIYKLDAESGKSELFKRPELSIDINQYEAKQIFYTSKDGTKVPMFIVSKKGVALNGNNPTLLYGYGGFDISLSPYFSVRWLSWLDMGGVFALANIRGGGEYGRKWHEAGMQLNKQNVFDDFIAAAEYLQAEKYTSKDKLTIMGGSNGGLLVGATMTQRPDLIKVALPAVGVLDMLRYHKFTAGAGWISDYGCADSSKTMFEYQYAYSPVHNVKEGVSYPATMVTTGDHDDRVVPAHSFKFISELQDKHVGDNPVLIRIETKGGHGAGKSLSMYLDELADVFAFSYYNMNVEPAYYSGTK